MSYKYGSKIYTYKDVEEAKKLIGKKVVASDSYCDMYNANILNVSILEEVDTDDNDRPFGTEYGCWNQFIREVIEDEPQYRPYNLEELAELVGRIVRKKGTNDRHLITDFQERKAEYFDGDPDVKVANLGRKTADTLLKEFEWLDGSECGVKEE